MVNLVKHWGHAQRERKKLSDASRNDTTLSDGYPKKFNSLGSHLQQSRAGVTLMTTCWVKTTRSDKRPRIGCGQIERIIRWYRFKSNRRRVELRLRYVRF